MLTTDRLYTERCLSVFTRTAYSYRRPVSLSCAVPGREHSQCDIGA